jgi:hydroxymethylpyrimidine pyrophosphatase-like HAD family hydrolase
VKYISLTEFCIDENGGYIHGRQAEVARYLRVTPHAVKKMLNAMAKAQRHITLVFDDADTYITNIEHSVAGGAKSADAA